MAKNITEINGKQQRIRFRFAKKMRKIQNVRKKARVHEKAIEISL